MRRLGVAALVLLAACGGEDGAAPGSSTTTTTTTTTTEALVEATVDWSTRAVSLTGQPEGWTVAACEGDAPLLCLSRDGEVRGALELLSFEAPAGSLDAWAEDLYRTTAEDRRTTCGYDVESQGTEPSTVAGRDGVRYGFAAEDEATLGYAVVVDGRLWLIATSAYEPGSCMAGEGPELTVDELRELEPTIAALAAGSELP